MANRPRALRQTDMTKAFKAAAAAGLVLSRVEVDPETGKITMTIGSEPEKPTNAYDAWKARRDARPA